MKPFVIEDLNGPLLSSIVPITAKQVCRNLMKEVDILPRKIWELDDFLKDAEVKSDYLILDAELKGEELKQLEAFLVESEWKKVILVGPSRTNDSDKLIYIPYGYTGKFNNLPNRTISPDLDSDRSYKSSFMGGNTSEDRQALADLIDPDGIKYNSNYLVLDSYIRFNKSYGLRYREAGFNRYLWSLDNAEAVISVPGEVCDCYRHYEAASRGCRLLTTKIPKLDIGLPKEVWIELSPDLSDLEDRKSVV